MRQGSEIVRRHGSLSVLWLIVVAVFGSAAARAADSANDAEEAAFLSRFASYVEWPADASAGPFTFAVSGDDGIALELERLLAGAKVHGRRARVRRVGQPADLEAGVHVLYIAPEALARTRALREAALKLPILIVTKDSNGFDAGGVINFVERGQKVRFEVSLVAADRQRLRIDSALLSVAARVERRPSDPVNLLNETHPGDGTAHAETR